MLPPWGISFAESRCMVIPTASNLNCCKLWKIFCYSIPGGRLNSPFIDFYVEKSAFLRCQEIGKKRRTSLEQSKNAYKIKPKRKSVRIGDQVAEIKESKYRSWYQHFLSSRLKSFVFGSKYSRNERDIFIRKNIFGRISDRNGQRYI